ncbi:hypothetical protein HanXRQr2_Chr02g0081781 [Helianthus annuus]|uniref:Uncharacterized protein n=1 Tax=Helianthus annuus TaxID=4232 RepID=A0A9K3JR37_HELAN|nr:hypothetical protein HanXRQr2_Chr02g0081781 [Helianthus annuus]
MCAKNPCWVLYLEQNYFRHFLLSVLGLSSLLMFPRRSFVLQQQPALWHSPSHKLSHWQPSHIEFQTALLQSYKHLILFLTYQSCHTLDLRSKLCRLFY